MQQSQRDLRTEAVQGLPRRVVARLDAWAASYGIRPDDESWAAIGAVLAAVLPVAVVEVKRAADDAARPLLRALDRAIWMFAGINLGLTLFLIAAVFVLR